MGVLGVSAEIHVAQVDDYLPCIPRKKNEPGQKVFFADLSDGEMYVPLLEKAFAKMFGSYQARWKKPPTWVDRVVGV